MTEFSVPFLARRRARSPAPRRLRSRRRRRPRGDRRRHLLAGGSKTLVRASRCLRPRHESLAGAAAAAGTARRRTHGRGGRTCSTSWGRRGRASGRYRRALRRRVLVAGAGPRPAGTAALLRRGGGRRHDLCLLGGLAGTWTDFASATSTVWSARPGAGTWTLRRPMPGPARFNAAVGAVGDRILVAGGCSAADGKVVNLDDILAYEPRTDHVVHPRTTAPAPARGLRTRGR
jgi:hypothetical protein